MNSTPTTEKPLTPAAVRRNRVQMQRLRAQTMEIAEDLKLGLMSADRDVKVAKLMDHMLDKGIRLKEVKGSDAISAAKMYADRRWPLRQDSAPASFTFTNVNLSLFLPDPLDSAQDVTPTTTGGVAGGGKIEKPDSLNESNTSNVR